MANRLCMLMMLMAPLAASLPRADPGFAVLDPSAFADRLGADYEWAKSNVPFLELEDPDILTSYYYRWRSYRKHIAQDPTDHTYVITEFLPQVGWAGKDNTIPAAAGHHIMEGRWIHDESILNDYITFWYRRGGNPYSYTNWIGWAALQRYKLNGNASFAAEVLPDLVAAFQAYPPKYLTHSGSQQCWWQSAGADAMEVAISGDGCRPTIASAMFGEASAVLELQKLAPEPNSTVMAQFEHWANFSRDIVLQQHWNPEIEAFAVIPGVPAPGEESQPKAASCAANVTEGHSTTDAVHVSGSACCTPVTNSSPTSQDGCCERCAASVDRDCQGWTFQPSTGLCWLVRWDQAATVAAMEDRVAGVMPGTPSSGCDLSAIRIPNQTVAVRELLGFMPWYYSSDTSQLISRDEAAKYAPMFTELYNATGGYGAKFGLSVAERRSGCWNYSWTHGDTWNQNSWPYETARVLTSMANVLNEYPEEVEQVTRAGYTELLAQYARQHTQTTAVHDTAQPAGSGHVFENLHPDLGYWNNRARMYWRNSPMKDMGDDYNHSTFNDLVLSGLLGIRALLGSRVSINPLIAGASYFAVDNVLIKGRSLAVVYDAKGTRYKKFKPGLSVLLDAQVVAHTDALGSPIVIDLAKL